MKHFERNFVIHDSSSSHKQILFRSFPRHGNEDNYLDILIQGVEFVFAPTSFSQMRIRIGSNSELLEIQNRFKCNFDVQKNLIVISDNNKDYYFIADKVCYCENEDHETSLPIKKENLFDESYIQVLYDSILSDGNSSNLIPSFDNWILIE